MKRRISSLTWAIYLERWFNGRTFFHHWFDHQRCFVSPPLIFYAILEFHLRVSFYKDLLSQPHESKIDDFLFIKKKKKKAKLLSAMRNAHWHQSSFTKTETEDKLCEWFETSIRLDRNDRFWDTCYTDLSNIKRCKPTLIKVTQPNYGPTTKTATISSTFVPHVINLISYSQEVGRSEGDWIINEWNHRSHAVFGNLCAKKT